MKLAFSKDVRFVSFKELGIKELGLRDYSNVHILVPENRPSQQEIHLPTTDFQGPC